MSTLNLAQFSSHLQPLNFNVLFCLDKTEQPPQSSAVAKYSVLADSQQSTYQTFLPSEEELRAELERDRAWLESTK